MRSKIVAVSGQAATRTKKKKFDIQTTKIYH